MVSTIPMSSPCRKSPLDSGILLPVTGKVRHSSTYSCLDAVRRLFRFRLWFLLATL